MLSALRLAAETQGGSYAAQGIHMGKADFKSAYKTLPADETQHWLCWAVVYNPDLERLQVVPLWSQVFGSLGGVTAWFRTARAIQHIMLVTFGLPIFLYVDDAFWASSGCRVPDGSTQSAWIGKVFQSVVTGLLGWELDADKACVGPALTLLGLDVRVSGFSSHWSLSLRKRTEWAASVRHAVATDSLEPGDASKMCGRFAFLNAYIFNRLGRALLRPLIWRQRQVRAGSKLTPRLRFALLWFLRVLEAGLTREISLLPAPSTQVVFLYSDAEGYGGLGAVAVFPEDEVVYLQGRVPRKSVRELKQRKTQIVAFELLAALVALVSLCPEKLRGCRVINFIDNVAALACVVRGFSREPDLADIAGRLWFEALALEISYRADFVPSKCNLADGPSRDDRTLMRALGARECVEWSFPVFDQGLGSWMAECHVDSRSPIIGSNFGTLNPGDRFNTQNTFTICLTLGLIT